MNGAETQVPWQVRLLKGLRRAIQVLLALGTLAAFAALFAYAVYEQSNASKLAPSDSQTAIYFATGLTAFVGGVVAYSIGNPDALPKSVGKNIGVGTTTPGTIVAVLYVLIYFLAGITAVGAWIASGTLVSTLIRNVAIAFAGLTIPILYGAFTS